MTSHRCPECGAEYSDAADSCSARFNQLLALDHSRGEPWGSRHGQAFAVFALQHPDRFGASLDVAWAALYRIYCQGEVPSDVFASLRDGDAAPAKQSRRVPPRPPAPVTKPTITIAHLGEFAQERYAALLDDWCVATLRAYGQPVSWPAPSARDSARKRM